MQIIARFLKILYKCIHFLYKLYISCSSSGIYFINYIMRKIFVTQKNSLRNNDDSFVYKDIIIYSKLIEDIHILIYFEM
jgi:hypothetical protein